MRQLSGYDVFHAGVSGGKDSTALLLWIVYESGLDLNKVLVTFCDTGNEDFLTYAYLDMLRQLFPIQTVSPDLDFWELAKFKKRFPSRKARFCTTFLKIIPTRDYILKLQQAGKSVLLLNGVRSTEAHASNDRGKVPEFGWDESTGCDIYRPILDWSIDDVWAIHKKYLPADASIKLVEADPHLSEGHKAELTKIIQAHGVPRNPLYDMGARRVGCFPCINSAKLEVRAMAKYRPERIDFIDSQEGSFKNGNMYSSLFARNTVPPQHRTKEVVTAKGETMNVCTIRDVVTWSQTAYGGKQYEMDLVTFDDLPACDIGGYCE